VFLDVVLCNEVADHSGVGRGFDRPAAVAGRVDEVADAVHDRRVDEGFVLFFFCVGAWRRDLDAEDTPDGTCLFEDSSRIVEIAFEERDVGLGRKELGGLRGLGTRDSDDFEGARKL